ncbi:MAG TPA: molecular chaperone TorD family protein [Anaerolineae bacterium]
MLAWRADLYHTLAEALAEPCQWLALPGHEWPLTQAAARLAPFSEAIDKAVDALLEVKAEPLPARRARYTALFAAPDRPRFWLYESMHCQSRFLSLETWALERLYRAAGLTVASAELPDHASLELAFLAYLAEKQAAEPEYAQKWRGLERRFIRQHAGRWLPKLGRALASSGDAVYAPIGALLAYWLEDIVRPRKRRPANHTPLPSMPYAAACTLCGFCAQVCPTRALAVHETPSETILLLSAAACIGCLKCERICTTHALSMSRSRSGSASSSDWMPLHRSPRVRCPGCGQATVSRAEIDFVAAQIGKPAWLEYCPECRSDLMEKPQ